MWILPTYRRPALLEQTLRYCAECEMSTPGLILVQGVNDIDAYKRIEENAPGNWIWRYLPENIGWAQGVNEGVAITSVDSEVIEFGDRFDDYAHDWWAFAYDDIQPHTKRFDFKLLERLKPGHFVSANNLWHVDHYGQIARLQTGIISGDLVRAVGFMCVPGTWACYTDDFWERLGNDLGIWIKANDIIIETNNPRKGDRPWDESDTAGYGSADKHEIMEQDRQIYQGWLINNYHQTYGRVSALLGRQTATPRRRLAR